MSQFTTEGQHKLMKGSSKTRTLDAARHFADFAQPVLVVWAGQDRLFPRLLDEHSLAAILTAFLASDAAR